MPATSTDANALHVFAFGGQGQGRNVIRLSRRQGLQLIFGTAQAVLIGAPASAAAASYDASVVSFGRDVVSYWKFENDGTDEKGTEDATFTGSPEVGVDTIVDLDRVADGAAADGKCIAWPGASGVYADAAHNIAHKTPEGSIVVNFQHDTLAQRSTLIAADGHGAAGGLSLEVQTDGSIQAFLRRQRDGAPVIVAGPAGDVGLGQAYTMIVKWGADGLALALWDDAGNLVRRVTDPLTDGVTGTSPIRFGAWHSDVRHHDGPYGRVIWFKRRIFDGEEAILARAKTIERRQLPQKITQLGAWPLSETSGFTFADRVGTNDATLAVPSWTIATHEYNRPGIVAGTDHALEVSNGGPAIAMAADYKQASMSLVIYVSPLSELRGTQYWDTSDARHGREFIAYCDDGSTPGSFAIERRRFSATEWRLDGYVRNGSGTAVRFSGGQNGIAGATLPRDTSKRIVLTQGPGGATLYLDGSRVANLAAVTQGWTSLTTAITLGSSSAAGHANDRSPLWGRLDQLEVWRGQMALADVQARAAAVQSKLWRYPSDFVGGTTDINIADYTNDGSAPRAAMDAAADASRYVYQAEDDATYYTAADQGGDNAVAFKPGCKGFINVRLKRPDGENSNWKRIFNISNTGGGLMDTSHGDPLAASGGWKFIGCQFDGNARGQNWHPKSGQPGYTWHGFDFQQAHLFLISNTVTQTFTFDACDFMDGTGDSLGVDQNTVLTVKSCRFWGVFRGPVVIASMPVDVQWRRSEVFSRSRSGFGNLDQGCGLNDIEPFGGAGLTWDMRDVWAESDLDDASGGTGSTVLYVNCHTTGGALAILPFGPHLAGNPPVDSWEARYCTFSYHSQGGNGGGLYPSAWWGHFALMGGTGVLFDHCVFLANGDTYNLHESWKITPNNAKRFYIFYESGGTQSRIWTMRDCQFRAKNLPAGLTTANVQAVDHASMSTAQSVELDGVLIDSAFADLPFNMGGMTVRYRNVLHERTHNTKPWSHAGAEVPI